MMQCIVSGGKFGRGTVKPPPHLTEMALTTLRTNPLPASRPESTSSKENGANGKKRERDEGDSLGEENNATGGGYSDTFRARQRSRLSAS